MGKGIGADRKESVLHVQKQSNNLEKIWSLGEGFV